MHRGNAYLYGIDHDCIYLNELIFTLFIVFKEPITEIPVIGLNHVCRIVYSGIEQLNIINSTMY